MLGEGIVKGLAETARNFFGSYADKRRLTTVQFPEERLVQPEATRVFPFLVYDDEDMEKGLRCVACKICEVGMPAEVHLLLKKAKIRSRILWASRSFSRRNSISMFRFA